MSLTSVDAELELMGRTQLDLLSLAPATDAAGKEDALALFDEDAGIAGSVEDFDVNFLSDFLMADGPTLPEPESPPPGPLADSHANEAMIVGAVPALEFVFDAARVQRKISGASSPSGSTTSASSDHSHHLEAAAEPKDDESPEERKARRRAQVAISARRHRNRKKNEMMELRKQVNALNNHLEFLRSKHKMMRRDGAVAEWEERAMAQRHKRRQAEELNEQLKYALFSQRGFVKDLKSVFSNSPMHSTELNMRYLLHTYTRLGKNPHSRFRDFQSICTNSKLDLAMQIVTRETDGVNFDTPSITTRQIQAESNEFGMTTVAVYAFNTPDINKIFVAACSAILSCGSDWPNYTLMSAQAKVVDSPAAHIRYGVSNARYTNDSTSEEILIEGRGTSYYRITDKYAVLLWDFVDEDDLYPLKDETDMKRDVIGAVIVRHEMCEDGVERVVCRNICTKVHALCKPANSQNIKFFSQHTLSGAKACGCRVYQQIKESNQRQVST